MSKHVTAYASAARTATPTAVTVATGRYNNMVINVDVTASAATPSVVVTVDALDVLSGEYVTVLTSAAFTGSVETRRLRIGPDIAAVADLAANNVLADTMRITCTHADADSITYSVGVDLR